MTGKGSGKRPRDKGQRGERELAAELIRIFGCEAHRGRQYQGGPGSPDVITNIPGLHWEVKRSETFSSYKSLEQAEDDAGEDEVGVVAHRRNLKQWIFVCNLDDLPKIVVQLYLELAKNA